MDQIVTEGEAVIRIRNLTKSYGSKPVLKGIDLEVAAGQVIGYIGPNGAGKSTTVRILAGLDAGFTGEVYINGWDVRANPTEVKKIVGYVPEQTALYDVLTPMEFLTLVGRLHHLPEKVIKERAARMLGFFGLAEKVHDRIDTFSKGMRQKVLLVSGLIHNPQIIFLDEPLAGLDANSVIMVKEIVSRLAGQGKTIFYCSHMMDVVEKVSDRIILINEGKILADGSFTELQKGEGATLERIFSQLTGQADTGGSADDFLNAYKDEGEDG